MKEFYKGALEISIAAILFSIIPVIVKFSTLDSYILSVGRIFFAVIFLCFWIYFTKTKLQSIKKNKLMFFSFGLFHAIIIFFFFLSIKLINAAIASLLLYSGFIYLIIWSYIFLKEKIETVTIASLIISIFGLFLIFYTPDTIVNFWGYLSGFLAGFFMSIVLIIGKVLSKKYDQITMTFFQNIIALPLMLPLLFFAEFDWGIVNLSTLVVLGVLCTGIAYLLLYSGMKKVKGQKVGILLLLEVVTPIFLFFVVFQEIPSLRQMIGCMMILIGFIMLTILSSNIKEEIEY